MKIPSVGRNWASVFYPDSLPEDFLQRIRDAALEGFLSPLHDKDLNADGKPKKPHYHFMITFSGNKSYSQMLDLFKELGGVGAERIDSWRGYSRYLCHLDNPEKARYSTSEVQSFGGLDYFEVIDSISDKMNAIGEMQQYVFENHIYTFADFCDYCRFNKPDWFYLINTRCAYVMEKYIKSNYQRSIKL